jgi:hypothetical protein
MKFKLECDLGIIGQLATPGSQTMTLIILKSQLFTCKLLQRALLVAGLSTANTNLSEIAFL